VGCDHCGRGGRFRVRDRSNADGDATCSDPTSTSCAHSPSHYRPSQCIRRSSTVFRSQRVAFDAADRLSACCLRRNGTASQSRSGLRSCTWTNPKPRRTERVIGRTESGKGGLLVAHRLRYQWWKLSSRLDPEAEFVREASWFRRYDPPNAQPLQMDGVSYLKAIWEDDAGRTWVAIGTIHIRVTDGGKTERTESSRVEVLDARNRIVIASFEFPERLSRGFSDGMVVTSEVRDNGRTVLSVVRLSLRP
jgi:hypothetical protein